MPVVGKAVTKMHVVSSLKQGTDFSVSVLGLLLQLRVWLNLLVGQHSNFFWSDFIADNSSYTKIKVLGTDTTANLAWAELASRAHTLCWWHFILQKCLWNLAFEPKNCKAQGLKQPCHRLEFDDSFWGSSNGCWSVVVLLPSREPNTLRCPSAVGVWSLHLGIRQSPTASLAELKWFCGGCKIVLECFAA